LRFRRTSFDSRAMQSRETFATICMKWRVAGRRSHT
jgi:hypothetical protein